MAHYPIKLRTVFRIFLRIGLRAYGGLPALRNDVERELVLKRHLISREHVAHSVDYGFVLPGSVLVIFIAGVGGRLRGFWGSVLAVFGYLLVPTASMIALGSLYMYGRSLPLLADAINGVTAALIGIIIWFTFDLARKYNHTSLAWIISLAAFSLYWFGHMPVVVLVLAGGLFAIIIPSGKGHHA